MTSDTYTISDVPGQPCLIKVTGAMSTKNGQLFCNASNKFFKVVQMFLL